MPIEPSSVYARKQAQILSSVPLNIGMTSYNYPFKPNNPNSAMKSSASDTTEITADDLSVSTRDTANSALSKASSKARKNPSQ